MRKRAIFRCRRRRGFRRGRRGSTIEEASRSHCLRIEIVDKYSVNARCLDGISTVQLLDLYEERDIAHHRRTWEFRIAARRGRDDDLPVQYRHGATHLLPNLRQWEAAFASRVR